MDDDAYKQMQMQENLKNPKNRFLGCFCHAKDVDSSWGCNWSFQTGVIMFSIVIFICSAFDVYEIAYKKCFVNPPNGLFTFFFIFKIVSDILNFTSIIVGCIAVAKIHLRLSIIAYWIAVVSFLLNTIFFLYIFIAIFFYHDRIWRIMITVVFLEVGLLLYSWILFANQVDVGRRKKAEAAQASNPF